MSTNDNDLEATLKRINENLRSSNEGLKDISTMIVDIAQQHYLSFSDATEAFIKSQPL